MGYVFMTSACCNCGQLTSYHPNLVPSIRIHGQREPVCEACIKRENERRQREGEELIVVQPGAYEPVDEHEVDWNG